jgi:hypothetical protein
VGRRAAPLVRHDPLRRVLHSRTGPAARNGPTTRANSSGWGVRHCVSRSRHQPELAVGKQVDHLLRPVPRGDGVVGSEHDQRRASNRRQRRSNRCAITARTPRNTCRGPVRVQSIISTGPDDGASCSVRTRIRRALTMRSSTWIAGAPRAAPRLPAIQLQVAEAVCTSECGVEGRRTSFATWQCPFDQRSKSAWMYPTFPSTSVTGCWLCCRSWCCWCCSPCCGGRRHKLVRSGCSSAAIALLAFRTPWETLAVGTAKGVWDALFILFVVWPALLLYRVTESAGSTRFVVGITKFSRQRHVPRAHVRLGLRLVPTGDRRLRHTDRRGSAAAAGTRA